MGDLEVDCRLIWHSELIVGSLKTRKGLTLEVLQRKFSISAGTVPEICASSLFQFTFYSNKNNKANLFNYHVFSGLLVGHCEFSNTLTIANMF